LPDTLKETIPMPAAIWTETAEPISARAAVEGGYFDLAQVVDHTGLAAATVRDALSRPPIEHAGVPLGALARPAARIGGVASPEPMWAPAQIAEYDRRHQQRAAAGPGTPELPEVTAADADARGLVSIETMAEEFQVAANTLRRWSRTYRDPTDGREPFPPEVAAATREPPNHRGRQHRLRNREQTRKWVREHLLQLSRIPERHFQPDGILADYAGHPVFDPRARTTESDGSDLALHSA
jgi:hypothetical protein